MNDIDALSAQLRYLHLCKHVGLMAFELSALAQASLQESGLGDGDNMTSVAIGQAVMAFLIAAREDPSWVARLNEVADDACQPNEGDPDPRELARLVGTSLIRDIDVDSVDACADAFFAPGGPGSPFAFGVN